MEIKQNREKFLKGTLTVSLAVILTKVMGVLYKVPLSYILGDEGMGYFNSAYAIYSFFYILCSSGVPKAITLAISKFSDRDSSSSYIVYKNGIKLFFIIGISVTAICIICAPALVNIIGSKKSLYTIIAIAPSISFFTIGGVIRGALNSYNRLSDIAVSQLLEAIIKLVLGLALGFVGYRMSLSLSEISALCVLGITAGCGISCAYLYITAKKIFKDNIFEQKSTLSSIVVRREVIKIALPISLGAAILNLSGIMDLGIIMRRLSEIGFSESESNAIYGNYTTLALPMLNLVMSLITPIMLAYLPYLAGAHSRDDAYAFSDTLRSMMLVNSIISIPSFFAFRFYSFDLLDILFSSSSSALAADLLATLSFGGMMLSLLTICNTALEAKGKITLTVFSLLLGSVVKGIGNYILIGRFGICGAPLSTVISYMVSLIVSIAALRKCGVKLTEFKVYLIDVLVGFICFLLPYSVFYVYAKPVGGVVSSFLCICISASLYFVFLGVRVIREKFETSISIFKLHKKRN